MTTRQIEQLLEGLRVLDAELLGIIELPQGKGHLPAAFIAWCNSRECGTHMAVWDERSPGGVRFDTGHYFTAELNSHTPRDSAMSDLMHRAQRTLRTMGAA